jgi:hypothetical protein
MVAATTLKLWRWGYLQWYDLLTEFHKNLPVGLEVNGGTDRHRRDGDLITYIFPLEGK